MSVDVMPASEASPRDYDGLFKSALEAYPKDALRLLFGVELDGREVVLEGPTEQQRHLTRSKDKVFVIRRDEEEQDRAAKNGLDVMLHEVYQIEVQVERTTDFEERMVSYWSSLAQRYGRSRHRIHQLVLWPRGGGYAGNFRRDGLRLRYHSLSVPEDLDPEELLASPLASLALWSKHAPADAVERVADVIAAVHDPDEQLVLVELGKLSPGPIAVLLIEAMVRRGMSDVLEQTAVGRDIARRNREEGVDEARIENMTALLRHNYEPIEDLDELARKLVATDHEKHREWVMDRVPLEQLRSV